MDNKIQMYFHCKKCTDLKTMKCTQKIAVGWTEKGIQVWCENCDSNVMAFDFLGQKIKYDK